MFQNLPPEAKLFQAVPTAQLTGRPGLHEHVVIIEVAGPPFFLRHAGGLLVVDVGHHLLPEGAIVKPVVPNPPVNHRIHRHGHLESGVWIH